MGFSCGATTSNSLTVYIATAALALPRGTIYEAQLGLAAENSGSERFVPFIATTSTDPQVFVGDLLPGTEYLVKTRHRIWWTGEWSNLTAVPISCATNQLRDGQPRVLPPRIPPTLTTILVGVAPPTNSTDDFVVEARVAGTTGAWSAPVPLDATHRALVTGLAPATVYELRARASSSADSSPTSPTSPPASDVVLHRTATPNVSNLTVFRISELCGGSGDASYTYDESPEYKRPCQPDQLYNHDSGTLLADVEFITATKQSGFVPDFNDSVTSRYCVSHEASPPSLPVGEAFADYVSCNGRDTEHYRCTCNVFVDRCIGRVDTSSCHQITVNTSKGQWKRTECDCSAESTAASAKYIGAMPVYYPFPRFNHKGGFGTQCSPDLVPPASKSTFLGKWYSMPEQSQCAAETVGLPGKDGCTWARRATHHMVHGFQLLGAGFNMSNHYDDSTLRQNDHVIEAVLSRHPVRCCDC